MRVDDFAVLVDLSLYPCNGLLFLGCDIFVPGCRRPKIEEACTRSWGWEIKDILSEPEIPLKRPLLGNREVGNRMTLPPAEFEHMVAGTLEEGTRGEGRGFVLMPTSCPVGRTISVTGVTNCRTLVRLAVQFSM